LTPAAEETSDDATVRRVVFGEHQHLRERLDTLDDHLAGGSGKSFVEAQRTFNGLLIAFLHHLEHEESLLIPVLRKRASWGPQRLAGMEAGHSAQRLQVAALISLDVDTSTAEWAGRMRQFAGELRADMSSEEHELVQPHSL
jgi:hypothetical protein